MEKKNTGIIILVVILALALGLLGGYIISDKIINKDNKALQNAQNNKPNNSDNNENTNTADREYSLTAAKELMNKYILDMAYITKLNYVNTTAVAIKNSKNGTLIKCEDMDNGSLKNITGYFADYKDTLYEQCKLDEEENDVKHNLYTYDEVLSKKKELFGDNSTLNKESFEYDLRIYYYSTDKKGFVDSLSIPAGYWGPISKIDEVSSAKIVDKDLEIIASNKIQNVDNPEKYDKYTYKYIFKQENNHYYLFNIIAVN